MNLTTSLWTNPMEQGRWNLEKESQLKNTLMMCGLCVTYAKNNGAHITMHCDSSAAKHLENFGYDDIVVDLDNLEIKKSSSTVMWAAGKFVALDSEPLGTIHIDNDVYLKSEKCIQNMEFSGYDFIIQNIENCSYDELEIFKNLIPTVDMDVKHACCVGIVGFNNRKLRDDYVSHYNYYKDNLEIDKNGNNHLNADLILEQVYLYNRMIKDGYTCKMLIGDIRKNTLNQIQQKSYEMKFEHMLGPAKYTPFILKRSYKELKEINPKIYQYIDDLKLT